MSNIHKINGNRVLVSPFYYSTAAMRLLVLTGSIVITTPLQPALAQNVSFDMPKQIGGQPDQDAEPPQIAASGKNVYVIWHEFPDNINNMPDVYFARSTNSGVAFPALQAGVPNVQNLSSSPAINSNEERIAASGGNVYVVWTEGDPMAQSSIVFRRSSNGGAKFEPPTILSTATGAQTPHIAASGKNVFVAWQANGPNGNKDIFFIQSSSAGLTFPRDSTTGNIKPINISHNDEDSQFRDGDARGRAIAVSGNDVIVTWYGPKSAAAAADANVFFAHGK